MSRYGAPFGSVLDEMLLRAGQVDPGEGEARVFASAGSAQLGVNGGARIASNPVGRGEWHCAGARSEALELDLVALVEVDDRVPGHAVASVEYECVVSAIRTLDADQEVRPGAADQQVVARRRLRRGTKVSIRG